MRRLISVLTAATVVAACGSTEPADVTTTTTAPEVTTTSSPPDPSTTIATTTTTTLPPTTTTTLLEGNWAEQPVVTASTWEGVLGWWDGSTWVQAVDGTVLPVSGGEDYQIALLGVEAITTGSARVSACDIFGPEYDFPGIELADPDLLSRSVDREDPVRSHISGVAISAPWDLTPREVVDGETHPDIEAVAVQILNDRGYDTATATILDVIDADLDGDGAIESIVVAEETELANEISGVYSVVFVLSPSSEEPAIVEESVIPASETGFPASFRVSAVADLSGDGVMEIVVDGYAWENSWLRVHEKTASGFESRISAGCGV